MSSSAEQLPDLDTVLVAVGGGGLFAGIDPGLAGLTTGPRGGRPSSPQTCPTLHRALEAGGPVDVQVGGSRPTPSVPPGWATSPSPPPRARARLAAGQRRGDRRRPPLAVARRPARGRAGRRDRPGGPARPALRPGRRRTGLRGRLRRQRRPVGPVSTASRRRARASRGRPTAGRGTVLGMGTSPTSTRPAPSAVAIEAGWPLDGGSDRVVGQLLAGALTIARASSRP